MLTVLDLLPDFHFKEKKRILILIKKLRREEGKNNIFYDLGSNHKLSPLLSYLCTYVVLHWDSNQVLQTVLGSFGGGAP